MWVFELPTEIVSLTLPGDSPPGVSTSPALIETFHGQNTGAVAGATMVALLAFVGEFFWYRSRQHYNQGPAACDRSLSYTGRGTLLPRSPFEPSPKAEASRASWKILHWRYDDIYATAARGMRCCGARLRVVDKEPLQAKLLRTTSFDHPDPWREVSEDCGSSQLVPSLPKLWPVPSPTCQ
jgi:hypothetical protein